MLNEQDREDLLLSCRFGDLHFVQDSVRKFGKHPLKDLRDPNGNTLLHLSSGNGDIDMLDYLLQILPPSLLSVQNNAGSTPLHWAAFNSHLDIVKKLVEFPEGPGVDLIDIKNAAGRSPLAEAEFAEFNEGAKWLVEKMKLDAGKEEEVEMEDGADEPDKPDIEVEIQDADGGLAKMTISGS